jgi:hypothetical protein
MMWLSLCCTNLDCLVMFCLIFIVSYSHDLHNRFFMLSIVDE